jgi:hypothetical protein
MSNNQAVLKSLCILAGFMILVPATVRAQSTPAEGAKGASLPCELTAIKAASPVGTSVTSVVRITSPVPYCRIDGLVISTKPGPNVNNFMIALPDGFAGRLFMINQGYVSGVVPPVPNDLIKAGFAVTGTDTGNSGEGYYVLADKAKALDQAYRGSHLVAVAAQALAKSYYGVSSMYRYAAGCSGGGRLGVNSAAYYPEDFDGIVAGANGNFVTFPAMARNGQYLKRHPEAWISPEQLKQMDAAILAKFDKADGAEDGIIWDPAVVHVDAETLPFLTPAQLNFVELYTSPVMNPDQTPYRGRPAIVPPLPITDAAIGWPSTTGTVAPDKWTEATQPVTSRFSTEVYRALFGLDFEFVKDLDFNDQRQMDFYLTYHAATRGPQPTGQQIANFGKAGHKLILTSQTSDQLSSYLDMVWTYNEIINTTGGLDKAQSFARLFLEPGLTHCGGSGPGPKDANASSAADGVLLKAIIDWVEKGINPSSEVAHRPASQSLPARTFLLCSYPDQAKFSGKGDVNDAANWSCKRHYQIAKAK